MKRICTLALMLIMILSLCACGQKTEEAPAVQEQPEQVAEAVEETALPEEQSAETITVLAGQKVYDAGGALLSSVSYFYNEDGYIIRTESDSGTETWEYDEEGNCTHTKTNGTTEEIAGVERGTWNKWSSYINICMKPGTREEVSPTLVVVGEDGILENWNTNPDYVPWFDYAEYTFDEAGYSTGITTYGYEGEILGTATCEWETIIPQS